ncbi:tRNA-splicing endonuclease subunit Sen34-like [Marmota marmota marmota]|uniref:tRNA-splicing endonuclease subunit Sen34-like n=1 Tax=Marmota marmota marmota TaxID=9994 RepID=UPI00209265D6|nr:tRNA-splicing endonuclease subunit Sen34-like [Marmota marmota marmota]
MRMEEEAIQECTEKFLVTHSFGYEEPDPARHGLPLVSFKRQQEQNFQEQSTLAAEARETRRQELLEKISEGQAAKKQKLEQNSGSCESQQALGSQVAEGNETGDSQASGEQEEAVSSSLQPGLSDGVDPLPRSALLVQLATARPRPIKAKPLDWRVQSKDWPHAGRPAHELRYRIYKDLWERGFFLSAAGKFGGDFLVYPGDPLHFHAHYIAQCWAPNDPIPPGSGLCRRILVCLLGLHVHVELGAQTLQPRSHLSQSSPFLGLCLSKCLPQETNKHGNTR